MSRLGNPVIELYDTGKLHEGIVVRKVQEILKKITYTKLFLLKLSISPKKHYTRCNQTERNLSRVC